VWIKSSTDLHKPNFHFVEAIEIKGRVFWEEEGKQLKVEE
jgi:hypothetical protein